MNDNGNSDVIHSGLSFDNIEEVSKNYASYIKEGLNVNMKLIGYQKFCGQDLSKPFSANELSKQDYIQMETTRRIGRVLFSKNILDKDEAFDLAEELAEEVMEILFS